MLVVGSSHSLRPAATHSGAARPSLPETIRKEHIKRHPNLEVKASATRKEE